MVRKKADLTYNVPPNINDYYVYAHICPDTGVCLYVGKGARGRAWVYSGGRLQEAYGCRDRNHFEYLNNLAIKGYIPCDWVVIKAKGLSNKDAYRVEKALIEELKPVFNKPYGKKLCKLTKEQVLAAKELYAAGNSYLEIGKLFNVSTMAMYRAITGTGKNYGKMFND